MAVTYVAQDISSLTSSQSCSIGTPGLELAKNALVVFNNLGVNVWKTGGGARFPCEGLVTLAIWLVVCWAGACAGCWLTEVPGWFTTGDI